MIHRYHLKLIISILAIVATVALYSGQPPLTAFGLGAIVGYIACWKE